MNKIKLILCGCGIVLLSGCATTALPVLVGAIGGAVIATELNQPRPIINQPRQVIVVPPHPRPLTCYPQFIGHNAHGRAIYQQVCR